MLRGADLDGGYRPRYLERMIQFLNMTDLQPTIIRV
jgi:hypothetical protein